MTLLELIRKRRSIRAYKDAPIEKESVELLIESLLRAPSSRSINPWQFVVVDDRELLTRLSGAKQHGSAFLKGAALGVVICADSTKSDAWVEDCSIAAILLQMTAESLGLGSCWIQIRNRQHNSEVTSEAFIEELLGLSEHVKVECIISIGHPGEKKTPLAASRLQYDKVNRNRYGSGWERGPV